MAKMIPYGDPYDENGIKSHENEIYDALNRIDDNELYVFYSSRTLFMNEDEALSEHEIDFIILHRSLGLLFLEAKASDAGPITYNRGWCYGNGKPMNHDPFDQADINKWNARSEILDRKNQYKYYRIRDVMKRTKFLHAVCFPTMTDEDIDQIKLPTNALREMIISKDDLEDKDRLWKKLLEIGNVPLEHWNHKTNLDKKDIDIWLDDYLWPKGKGVPLTKYEKENREYGFKRLLNTQISILDFLNYQTSVAITGGAGTGKTMIAIEKARRLTYAGDNVLFLCFNRELKNRLEANYQNPSIKFYTLAGFVMAMTGSLNGYRTVFNNLEALNRDNMMLELGTLKFKHVIIDEGQDFGTTDEGEEVDSKEKELRGDIIAELSKLILSHGGSFYVFYDRMQLIQANAIPKFIEETENRLCLSKNCRNTEDICKTAIKCITNKRFCEPNEIKGDIPNFYFVNQNNCIDSLNNALDECLRLYKDIVIISMKTKNQSDFKNNLDEEVTNNYKEYFYNYRNNKIPFTTSRKFKGCEADAVILVDVTKENLVIPDGKNTMENFMFYVGASRAKQKLQILAQLEETECLEVLQQLNERYMERPPKKNIVPKFIDELCCNLKENN